MESFVSKHFSRQKKARKFRGGVTVPRFFIRGGHGSRVPNSNDREKDGYDEVSGPSDLFFFFPMGDGLLRGSGYGR